MSTDESDGSSNEFSTPEARQTPNGDSENDVRLEFTDSPCESDGAAPEQADHAQQADPSDWYFTKGDGGQEGPVSLSMLQEMIADGRLDRRHLVWRDGEPEWREISSVPELAAAPAPPIPPGLSEKSSKAFAGFCRLLEGVLATPIQLRVTGGIMGILSLVTLLVSLVLMKWGYTWFTGALLLGVCFVVCMGMARVVEMLSDLEAKCVQPDASMDPPNPSDE